MCAVLAALLAAICTTADAFTRSNPRKTTTALAAKPKAVIFDLDGCLWYPEMYMMSWRGGGAPFVPKGDAMVSQAGEAVTLLGDVRAVVGPEPRAPDRPVEEAHGRRPALRHPDEGEALAEAPRRLGDVQLRDGVEAAVAQEHLRLHVADPRVVRVREELLALRQRPQPPAVAVVADAHEEARARLAAARRQAVAVVVERGDEARARLPQEREAAAAGCRIEAPVLDERRLVVGVRAGRLLPRQRAHVGRLELPPAARPPVPRAGDADDVEPERRARLRRVHPEERRRRRVARRPLAQARLARRGGGG